MSLETNKDLVRRFLAAMKGPDRADLQRMLAPDARWILPGSAPEVIRGAHDGREAILDLLLTAARKMLVPGSVAIEIEKLIAEGDDVVALVHFSGTTTQGRQYDNQYVFVFHVLADVITEFSELPDTLHAASFFEL